jgi:hypothetical protein
MKRRTRHALILIGAPTLLVLALGGWIVEAIRTPLTLHQRVVARRPSVRGIGPNHHLPTKLTTPDE